MGAVRAGRRHPRANTDGAGARVRLLPSRVGVYFVLALALFPSLGYTRVWGKLTAGLWELGLARPSEEALREVRRRLGAVFGPLETAET